jgi:transcriptional regulator with XRE-family HTH domain
MATPENGAPIVRRAAENVRALRQLRGLSLDALAQRLEQLGHPIALNGLSKLENGKRGVDVDDLIALAIALDCSPNRLMLTSGADEKVRIALTPKARISEHAAWRWAAGDEPIRVEPWDEQPTVFNVDRVIRFADENRPHDERDNWSIEKVEEHEDLLGPVALAARVARDGGVPNSTLHSYIDLSRSFDALYRTMKARPRTKRTRKVK